MVGYILGFLIKGKGVWLFLIFSDKRLYLKGGFGIIQVLLIKEGLGFSNI